MTDHQIAVDGLNAAQASASYAGASAWASWVFGIVGLVLNAGALFFVWRTLKSSEAAARAATAAVEVAQAETRPWIKVETPQTGNLRLFSGLATMSVSVNVTLENIGRTPATDVSFAVEALIDEKGTDWSDRIQTLARSKGPEGSTLFPGDKLGMVRVAVAGLMEPGMLPGFRILGVVSYRAGRNGPIMNTPFLLMENGLTTAAVIPGDHTVNMLTLVKAEVQPT